MHIANNILKHSLQSVYFLVGTACGGKITMAKAISQKHGFTYFNGDHWDKPNPTQTYGTTSSQCIKSLTNPAQKFETQNTLFKIGAKETAHKAQQYQLFSLWRDDASIVPGTLEALAQHFGIK